ncbi:MAG: ACT domain-containing protein [Ethanoligenens sp.]|uniref:ACT domain-containing protein n=1 Tax=Ethanoligenens sp. TaxID=2099655 RepID=UPI0039EC19BF
MERNPRYLIVDSQSLPDVFLKVLDAKLLLNTGQAHSVNEAARLAGISRSAFYKYKGRVRPYDDEAAGRIVTISAMLRDEAGVLSALTGLLYQNGANILTINQNIPVDGIAPVSVTARMDNIRLSLTGLLTALREVDGVENVEIVSGA